MAAELLKYGYDVLELCRTRVGSDYRGGGGGGGWRGLVGCLGNCCFSLYAGRSPHTGSDRFWLNDSSEVHIRKRISPWAGTAQWNGVKPVQSPNLSPYIFDPLMFSSITYCPPWRLAMIYHRLVPPSTPGSPLHFTLLIYRHNLLCHTDLPGLCHSKQTTTHRWSQDVSCPLTQFASA